MSDWKSKALGVVVIAGGIGAAMPYRHAPSPSTETTDGGDAVQWQGEIVPLRLQAGIPEPTEEAFDEPAEPPRVDAVPTLETPASPPQLASDYEFAMSPESDEALETAVASADPEPPLPTPSKPIDQPTTTDSAVAPDDSPVAPDESPVAANDTTAAPTEVPSTGYLPSQDVPSRHAALGQPAPEPPRRRLKMVPVPRQ